MRCFALFAVLLASLAAIADPPDAASMDAWIADLGAEDGGKRDEAEKKLAAVGEGARDRIRRGLLDEKIGAESRSRLERLMAALDHAVWWAERWKESPIDLAYDYVKDKRCLTCGQDKVPYDVAAIEHPGLAKRFPGLRFFSLDWICCQDHPEPTLFLVVGKDVDVRFEIGAEGDKWALRIAPYVPKVTTAEDAREAASLLTSLCEQPDEFDAKVVVDPARGSVTTKDGAFVVRIPWNGNENVALDWEVRFDKDGTLVSAGEVEVTRKRR